MGRFLRRLLVGTGLTVTVLGGGGGVVYYRRLKENRSTTADAYNAEQNQKELQVMWDTILTKDAPPAFLYRYTTCPFCGKVKAFLDYHKIPHECVEVEPMFKSEIANSPYKKVPQMTFHTTGHHGPSLVDSDIIVDDFAKRVGWGAQLTDPSIVEWRGWARETLVRFLVLNINTSLAEAWRGYGYIDAFDTIPYANKVFLKVMGAPVMWGVANYFTRPKLIKSGQLKDGDDVRTRLHEEVQKFVEGGLNATKGGKFHGGSKPDIADLDIYGVLQSVRGHRVYDDILASSALKPWLDEMDKATGKEPYTPSASQ